MMSWCSEQNSRSKQPLSWQLPILCLPRTPFHSSKSLPTFALKSPEQRTLSLESICRRRLCRSQEASLLHFQPAELVRTYWRQWQTCPRLGALGTWCGLKDQLASSALFWQCKFWSWSQCQRGSAHPCSSQTRRGYSLLNLPLASLVQQSVLCWEQQYWCPAMLVPWPWVLSIVEDSLNSPALCKCSSMLLWGLLSPSFVFLTAWKKCPFTAASASQSKAWLYISTKSSALGDCQWTDNQLTWFL